jgi:hypothetical protein
VVPSSLLHTLLPTWGDGSLGPSIGSANSLEPTGSMRSACARARPFCHLVFANRLGAIAIGRAHGFDVGPDVRGHSNRARVIRQLVDPATPRPRPVSAGRTPNYPVVSRRLSGCVTPMSSDSPLLESQPDHRWMVPHGHPQPARQCAPPREIAPIRVQYRRSVGRIFANGFARVSFDACTANAAARAGCGQFHIARSGPDPHSSASPMLSRDV